MKEIELEYLGEKVQEITIKLLESFMEINLPKQYRAFLMNYNGGSPKKYKCFNFYDKSDGSVIQYLFGIETIVDEIKCYMWDERRIPWNFFPIANDSFGNLICISVKGPDYGKIYFWDHEMEADPAQGEDPAHYYENVTLIADSFDEFIDGLYDFNEKNPESDKN